MANDYIQDKVFFSKYKAERRIGEGSFGKIYLGIHVYFNITIKQRIFKPMNALP